jgi:DNA gyrase subunit B
MDKYVYTYSDDELQRKLAETTMDPRRRTLRRLTVDDAEAAAKVFELLMGSEVAPRKEFLVQGAYEIDAATLDA